MPDAKRWRIHDTAAIAVIVASVAVAIGSSTLDHRSASPSAAPSTTATALTGTTTSPSAPSAPSPPKPTRAALCTFLGPGDFAAVGVPSPAITPWFGPGGTSPLPGQLTCRGRDDISYAMFWDTDPTNNRQLYTNDRQRRVDAHWDLISLTVPGADTAYWLARDDLPTIPATPDQQALLYTLVGNYTMQIEIPRSTPDAGDKLRILGALLIARIARFGYGRHSPTDGMS